MKRESIAERTLNNQIKILKQRLSQVEARKENLEIEAATIEGFISDLNIQIDKLRNARVSASEKAKS